MQKRELIAIDYKENGSFARPRKRKENYGYFTHIQMSTLEIADSRSI